MTRLTKWITLCFIIAGIFAIERLVTQSTTIDFSNNDSFSALTKPTNQRLFLLLVDGMPYRTATDSLLMPNLVRLQKQSAFAKVNTTFEAYSSSAIRAAFSGTSQNSIFDVINNFKHDKALHIKSIFTDLKKASIDVSIYSDGHFNQFGDVFTNSYQRLEGEYYTDTDKRIPLLAFNDFQLSSTPFVIAHYETTDWAGHQFGTESAEYNRTYQHIDSLIGVFSKQLKSNEHLIVVGDHGMNELGEHKTGMNIPTYLSLTGNLIHKNTDLGTFNITQVKDIIAIVFNTPINPYQSPIKNLLPGFTINPDNLNIQAKSLNTTKSFPWLKLSFLILFLMGFAIYGISESTHKLDFIPIVFLFLGVLSTSILIQIGLLLVALLSFYFIRQKNFQFSYSLFLVGFATVLLTYITQKLGFVKTSPAAIFLILSLLSLLFQKQLKLHQKNAYLILVGVGFLLFISLPYRFSAKSISIFAPIGMTEIILIYAIGILSKAFIYFKDTRSLKAGIFPLFGLIISLLPELQAVNSSPFSEKFYFILFGTISLLGLSLSFKYTNLTELRKSTLLTLLFLLLYHSYQIPIYHYFFFDISLATLYLFLGKLKSNHKVVISSILLSAVLFGSATLINATTNGIEWKFLYSWFDAVYVEKNMWLFFPIILLKFLIPVLIIKQVFKPFLNQDIISFTIKIGSNLFVLSLILFVIDYGIMADKVFFNTSIELFLTNVISLLFLF